MSSFLSMVLQHARVHDARKGRERETKLIALELGHEAKEDAGCPICPTLFFAAAVERTDDGG